MGVRGDNGCYDGRSSARKGCMDVNYTAVRDGDFFRWGDGVVLRLGGIVRKEFITVLGSCQPFMFYVCFYCCGG